MKKCVLIVFCLLIPVVVQAHFGMILPSSDIVSANDSKRLHLLLQFVHPFEGHYLNMERPQGFGVVSRGQQTDLLDTLRLKKQKGLNTWETEYPIKRPGDLLFFVSPVPYFEPAEDCYIVHYSKVVVGALGLELGWDEPIGLETEIIPLTRPYGLWSGNLFRGKVLLKGQPAAHCTVEIEYYNKGGEVQSPSDPYVTQVVKTDSQGIFSYAMPRAGWWGFAALNTSERKILRDGEEKSIEIGAVLWVKTIDMP